MCSSFTLDRRCPSRRRAAQSASSKGRWLSRTEARERASAPQTQRRRCARYGRGIIRCRKRARLHFLHGARPEIQRASSRTISSPDRRASCFNERYRAGFDDLHGTQISRPSPLRSRQACFRALAAGTNPTWPPTAPRKWRRFYAAREFVGTACRSCR